MVEEGTQLWTNMPLGVSPVFKVLSSLSVSYTHLDVYKRQVQCKYTEVLIEETKNSQKFAMKLSLATSV